ncbi:MAG: SBBP repeat-containing protein, partial [Ignavibacteriales bacterium]|nr:SBBP repeat-containing protein [Ignavibacteriales bacterium]
KPLDPRKLPRVDLSKIPQKTPTEKVVQHSSSSGVTEEWVARYDGGGGQSGMEVRAVGVDSIGNAYAVGLAEPNNIVMVKYSSDGIKQWEVIYTGPEDISRPYALYPTDVAVDRMGNVFIVMNLGYQDFESYEVITVKFSSNGVKQWEQRYTDTGYLYGDPYIAVDKNSNCLITFGFDDANPSTGYGNIITIKYNTAGVQQWIAEYNGEANLADFPTKIKVDTVGYVYILGITESRFSNYDIVTLKYNPSGSLFWDAVYNSPQDGYDWGSDITVDAVQNIYVTSIANGEFTLKYNSAGTLIGVFSYGGYSITTDWVGNILLAGNSLKKLNSTTGDTIWTRPYSGEYVTVDASNNIYLGRSSADSTVPHIRKISAAGTLNWSVTYSPVYYMVDMVLGANGNLYITGTDQNMITIQYSPFGDSVWVGRYTNTFSYPRNDVASAMTIDGSGNVYVTGTSGWNKKFVTIKYNAIGETLWVRNYSYEYYPGNSDNNSTGIAVDNEGNVFVTGYSYRGWSFGYHDYLTIKYNSSGDTLWTRTYNGTGNSEDFPVAVAIDALGNLYVTGYSYQAYPYLTDIVTVKYNPMGDTLWTRAYNGGYYYYDYPTAMKLDNDNNVYVTGYSYPSSTQDSTDMVTIKYSSGGDSQWVQKYDGTNHFFDKAQGIVVDGHGNVIVAGYSSNSSGGYTNNNDYVTIKYNTNGTEKWVRRYDGTANGDDVAASLCVDGQGNIYTTGRSETLGTLYDFATVKYDSNGIQKWVRFYDGTASYFDEANDIALDGSGNIYVTGRSYGSGTVSDYATVKYTPTGDEEWSVRYTNSGLSDDYPVQIKADGIGNVFVTGTASVLFPTEDYVYDIVTIMYSQEMTAQTLVDQKWNIVSVPVHVSDWAKTSIFPTSISNAFLYQGGYAAKDTLETRRGYWLKFDSAQTIQFGGSSVGRDTIPVDAGWNMIGSISLPVPTSSITSIVATITSSFFGYNNGYADADTIMPGKGYWVKVDTTGALVLSSGALNSKNTIVKSNTLRVEGYNRLIVEDVSGYRQTLYFGNKTPAFLARERYELPPLPPDGIPDVRFATGSKLETADEKVLKTIPLLFSSVTFPLTIKWKCNDESGKNMLLIDGKSVALWGKGTTQIPNSQTHIALMLVPSAHVSIPKEFALKQNYPNPFNPVTVISYQLSVKSHVQLRMYNLLGEEVTTLVDEIQDAGFKEIDWDAGNKASGVYFCRMIADGADGSRYYNILKMVLSK